MTTVYHKRVAYPGQETERAAGGRDDATSQDWSATDESVAESG
jgi:hypothetical protein